MATLKGQNLRVFTVTTSGSTTTTKCIGLASTCIITMTGNSEEVSSKDDVGMASKPNIVSLGWQVQVESFQVQDAAAMLTAIKSMTPFKLMWDETDTTNNQTAEGATFARTGMAYLSDGTFVFNDRENSTKNLQFTGSGDIAHVASAATTTVQPIGYYTKGQYTRLFLAVDSDGAADGVIAYAKQLQLHVSVTMEDASTKDTYGIFQVQEPTAISYDISTTALVRSGETITSNVPGRTLTDIEAAYEWMEAIAFKIATVNPAEANNRTALATIVSGQVVITQLSINAANKSNATYTAQLQGYGAYAVGA